MRKLICIALALVAFAVAISVVPVAWCGRGAAAWLSDDRATTERLARVVSVQVGAGLSTADFQTGTDLFNGEWLFGTYVMGGIGLCQVVQRHPDTAEQWTPGIEACIRGLLSEPVKQFDTKSWGADAIASLDTMQGHAAYLGYLNVLLGMYRQIHPNNEFAELNDKITAALVRRVEASRAGLIETYPDEWYPVDNSSVIASIAIHGQATGKDYSALLARVEKEFRANYVEPGTGLLIQAANGGGKRRDVGRGSGSALTVFFLKDAYPGLSEEIFHAIRKELRRNVLGFGAIREYPAGGSDHADIDSGPIILGFGFSATGFSICGAKAYGDDELFRALYASAVLAGAPVFKKDSTDFLTAGPLGNAILLAMFTTPRMK